MNKALYYRYITYGLYFGMAISSRFLLDFFYADNTIMNILYWLLLFLMFSALTAWVGKYKEQVPDKKLTFKTVNKLTFIIFLTASLFSSAVKYVVFVYISPIKYKLLSSLASQLYNQTAETIAKNTSLSISPEVLQMQQWQFSEWGMALMQGISNMVWGFFAALMVWSVYRNEQKFNNTLPSADSKNKNQGIV